ASADAHAELAADVEDLPGGDVAGDEVLVLGVLLLEEVPAFVLGDAQWITGVALLLRHPDATALAADGLRHEAELVLAGDGGGGHLDELAVGVGGSLDVRAAGGGTGVDDRVGRAPEDDAWAAGGQHHRLGGDGSDLHGAEVHGHAPDDAAGLVLHHPQ